MAYGAPVASEFAAAIDSIDLRTDYCWGQLANNSSMAAALGLSDANYGPSPITGLGAGLVGRFVVAKRKKGLSFPDGEADAAPDEGTKAAIRDRDYFLDRLGDFFGDDLTQIRADYEENAAVDGNGTHSAQNLLEDDLTGRKISLLGVEAANDVALGPMSDPSVPPAMPIGVP